MADEKKLIYKLEAQNAKYLKALDQAQKKLDRFAKQTRKDSNLIKGLFTKMEKSAKGLALSLAAAFSARAITRGIINTAREFEKLNAQLKTIEGSERSAAIAFKRIQDFATTTPFQLAEVVDAYVRLKNRGIEPTTKALEGFGNISSSMGKSLEQISEAVADAVVGEFERLKEFGIKANKQGDTVKFTFRGVTQEVKNSANDIQKYLEDIGNIKFAGAMSEQMETLNGVTSNLSDAFAKLALKIDSKIGLTGALKNAGLELTAFINGLAGVARPVSDIENEIQQVIESLNNVNKNDINTSSRQGRRRASSINARQVFLKERLEELKEELLNAKLLSSAIPEVESGIDDLNNRIELLQQKIDEQFAAGIKPTKGGGRSKNLTQLGRDIEKLEDLQKRLQTALEHVNDIAASDAGNILVDIPKQASILEQIPPPTGIPTGTDNVEDLTDSYKDLKSLLQELRSPQEIYLDLMRQASRLQDAGAISQEEYNKVIAEYATQLDKASEKTKKTTTEISVYWDQAQRNMQDALADSLFSGFEDGLEGLVKSFSNALKRMAAEALAANIFNNIFGASGGGNGNAGLISFFSGVASAFVGGGGASSASASGTGGFDQIFAGAFAKGGKIPDGQFGLVGENGPELIRGPANVTSQMDTAEMIGNKPVNIRLVNAFDTSVIDDYFNSPAGEQTYLNIATRNGRKMRQIMSNV